MSNLLPIALGGGLAYVLYSVFTMERDPDQPKFTRGSIDVPAPTVYKAPGSKPDPLDPIERFEKRNREILGHESFVPMTKGYTSTNISHRHGPAPGRRLLPPTNFPKP